MSDQDYIKRAVQLSLMSPEPIGCGAGVVLVGEDGVLAEAYNSQHADNLAIYHAEIKALIEASKKRNARKLEDVTAYCSCEPCAMCLTALSYAKIGRIVFHKRMIDIFPDDPQSRLDPYEFIKGLNFIPKLQQLIIKT